MNRKLIKFSNNIKLQKKYIIILIISILFFTKPIYSFENKILAKVNNEIITTQDVYDEINYLLSLNTSLSDLNKAEIFQLAKNSLIKEKVKEIELLNYKKNFDIDENIFEKIIILNYSKYGLDNKDKFLEFIKNKNIEYSTIKKKLAIEIFWNELIYSKFSSKIKIDENKLKKEIEETKQKKKKSYLLYEIVLNINDSSKIDLIFEEIKTSIADKGFKNTASLFSASDTSKLGGEIGWVNDSSLNPKVKAQILNLNVGEYTKPILIPGGFIILKLDDIKETDLKIDLEQELENLIKTNSNQQLNQYSNLYFNKIKKEIYINE